jgi:hypothetical protein
MAILRKIGTWLAKVFKNIKTDGAKTAVAITEGLQTGLKLGILSTIADVVSALFPVTGNLPRVIVADLDKALPKILAAELAIEGLPDKPSQQDMLDFENRVLTAFNVHDDNSKLWTSLAAQVYGIIQKHAGEPDIPFSRLMADVEEAYQDYKADLTDTSSGTALPA